MQPIRTRQKHLLGGIPVAAGFYRLDTVAVCIICAPAAVANRDYHLA